jgi:hypothetical protein
LNMRSAAHGDHAKPIGPWQDAPFCPGWTLAAEADESRRRRGSSQ